MSSESAQLVKDVPLAVARIEKTILEALLTNHLSLDKDIWNVLVKEAEMCIRDRVTIVILPGICYIERFVPDCLLSMSSLRER